MDEMPEYLRLVRGGRPGSAELVAEMRHNYEAIGGRSPLTELTTAQAAANREHRAVAGLVLAVLLLCLKASYNDVFWRAAGTSP